MGSSGPKLPATERSHCTRRRTWLSCCLRSTISVILFCTVQPGSLSQWRSVLSWKTCLLDGKMNPWPGQKRSTFHTLMCSEVAWRLCLLHCQHSAISWPQSTPNWLHDFTSFATLHCVCINNNLSGTASVICIIRKNRKIPACVSPTGTSTPSVGHCRTCLDFATASGKRIRCGPACSTASCLSSSRMFHPLVVVRIDSLGSG